MCLMSLMQSSIIYIEVTSRKMRGGGGGGGGEDAHLK